MEMTHSLQNKVLLVTLEGKNLDAKDALQFKQKVLDLIQHQRANQLVVDLHQLQFVDSSGLSCFLSLLKGLNESGGSMKLACMSKPVRSIFELVGMLQVFEIYSSSEEALQSY